MVNKSVTISYKKEDCIPPQLSIPYPMPVRMKMFVYIVIKTTHYSHTKYYLVILGLIFMLKRKIIISLLIFISLFAGAWLTYEERDFTGLEDRNQGPRVLFEENNRVPNASFQPREYIRVYPRDMR